MFNEQLVIFGFLNHVNQAAHTSTSTMASLTSFTAEFMYVMPVYIHYINTTQC